MNLVLLCRVQLPDKSMDQGIWLGWNTSESYNRASFGLQNDEKVIHETD